MNQLLTEMDGFASTDGIIVLAATNRMDILDDALLRPGRFDRIIHIRKPSLQGREDIFKVHCKSKRVCKNVDLHSLALNTVGFTGAQIENICNEAAIRAVANENECIHKEDFEYAIDKLRFGTINNALTISKDAQYLIAVHEAGHTLLGMILWKRSVFDKIVKVSIQSRGGAGGLAIFEPDEDNMDMQLYSQQYLINQIMVAMGGRLAEEQIFGTLSTTTGAIQDIKVATDIAYRMVTSYGFNQEIGPIDMNSNYSNLAFQKDVEKEVQEVIQWSYVQGKNYITMYERELLQIANALIEKQVLSHEDLWNLVSLDD
jgi:cell division protease FtsH